MFRELMPLLGDEFYLVAPDFPAFGFTEVPSQRDYQYSFASMANTLSQFMEALSLRRYALYVFDYGAPIGFRHALNYPGQIMGIISQNGNIYEEGLGEAIWRPVRTYWNEPTPEHRKALRGRLSLDGVRDALRRGAPHPEAIAPESYWLDAALMARPGNSDIQLDPKLDYASNVALYPNAF
jgi:pimeloyl-ACP methyl ester carboxylesterase